MKTEVKKKYTQAFIAKQFSELTQAKKIEILYEALDYMEQCNARTKMFCIAMALGYENYEGGIDTYTRK